MQVKSLMGEEDSEGNKEHVFGNQRKGCPCSIMGESLGKFCPVDMWKAEFSGYTAKKISKQSDEGKDSIIYSPQ